MLKSIMLSRGLLIALLVGLLVSLSACGAGRRHMIIEEGDIERSGDTLERSAPAEYSVRAINEDSASPVQVPPDKGKTPAADSSGILEDKSALADAQTPDSVRFDALRSAIAFSGIAGLQSEVRARIYRGKERQASLTGIIAYRPPDTFRLQLFDPFGSLVVDMVRVVGMINIYMPAERLLYVGWAPPMDIPDEAFFHVHESDGMGGTQYVLDVLVPREQGTRDLIVASKYYFDSVSLENTRIDAYRNGRGLMRARFNGFEAGVPHEIRFEPVEGVAIELTLKKPDLHASLSDSLFHPFEKHDVTVRPLEALVMDGR